MLDFFDLEKKSSISDLKTGQFVSGLSGRSLIDFFHSDKSVILVNCQDKASVDTAVGQKRAQPVGGKA